MPDLLYRGDQKSANLDWGIFHWQRSVISGQLEIHRIAPSRVLFRLIASVSNYSQTAGFQAKVVAQVFADRQMLVSIEAVTPEAPGRGVQPFPTSRGAEGSAEMELPANVGAQVTRIIYNFYDFKDIARAPEIIEATGLAWQLIPVR